MLLIKKLQAMTWINELHVMNTLVYTTVIGKVFSAAPQLPSHIRITSPSPPRSHLFVEVEFVQLWEHPAHAAISSTHQDTKRYKLLEQAQAKEERRHKHSVSTSTSHDSTANIYNAFPSGVPELRPSVHQVEDLSWVEKLLKLAEELDPLVVPAFGVT